MGILILSHIRAPNNSVHSENVQGKYALLIKYTLSP